MLSEIVLENLKNVKLQYSIYVKNLNDGTVSDINIYQRVPSASIIKLFIMAAAFKSVEEGNITLNKRINIKREEKVPYSIVTLFDDEDSFTLKDLIILMIIQSDNTATNKIIDIIGMDYINGFIKDQGFKNTVLKRKMMDSLARKEGRENYTSAQDIAALLESIYLGKLVNENCSHIMKEILTHQLDESMMRINLPDSLTVAHKTGDLEGVKHDTGIVYASFGEYIFIMLTWNSYSDNYARNVIGNTSNIVYNYFLSKAK